MTERKPTTAGVSFRAARESFDLGDFHSARQHSRAAASLVLKEARHERWGPTADPQCSIVVVSQAAGTDVLEALESLAPYAGRPEFDLVVIDNGNRDLYALARLLFRSGQYVSPGFNYGCSGGRNLGASMAAGRFVLFADDDGIVRPGSVESLLETISWYRAVAVRGRIHPRSAGGGTSDHYDLGDQLMYNEPNAEGLSIWDKDQFLSYGGFDPLLYGHEGIKLCCEMIRSVGPKRFLYDPNAVLYHDYASGDNSRHRKEERYKRNFDYLRYCGIEWEVTLRYLREANKTCRAE